MVDRKQETEEWAQETGDGRQKTGDRRQETGDGRRKTGGRRDGKQEMEHRIQEMVEGSLMSYLKKLDRRRETGA